MKIVTVVGARPQFVKAAAVSRVIRTDMQEILVHTGQHYDANMSDIFFEEMQIPRPDYHLGVGSGSHARQTGDMMVGIEAIIMDEKPDYVMVYGDTNSTLAAALAAVKVHCPIIHIEAGLRSFNMRMPEEVNRILTDRISTLLFCPTDTAVANLKNEGLTKGVFNIGDVMCDAVRFYEEEIEKQTADYYFDRLNYHFGKVRPEKWYIATIHRAENTDDINKISNILDAFEQFDEHVIFPVHPRTISLVKRLRAERSYKNIIFVEPMGYLDMLFFTKNAKKAVTDSGGLQKEAYMLATDCVTIRDQTEWIETLAGGYNILAKPDTQDILNKVFHTEMSTAPRKALYGTGNAAEQLLKIIQSQTNC